MPIVYDSPIGPTPGTGAPMGSLLGSHSMIPIPPLNFTGGSAGPSGSDNSGGLRSTVISIAGGGGWLWISMAAVLVAVIWKHHAK